MQAHVGRDITAANDRLADLDANLTDWQEILDLAASLTTRCGDTFRKASDRTRKLFNAVVFDCLDMKDGQLCYEQYRPPIDDIFNVSQFYYGTRVEVAGIEPASFSSSAWLLRVQLDVNCRNWATTSISPNPYSVSFHRSGPRITVGLSPFDLARYYTEELEVVGRHSPI